MTRLDTTLDVDWISGFCLRDGTDPLFALDSGDAAGLLLLLSTREALGLLFLAMATRTRLDLDLG